MRTIVLALVLAFTVVAPVAAYPDASDVAADAGASAVPDITQTVVVLPPSTALPEPIEQPAVALTDVQLARKTSWPLAVWAVLALLGKALAYGRDRFKSTPVVGKLAAWLATGKAAMGVAAIGAVGCAGYDVLVHGGTLTAALVASGVAVAGMTHSTTQAQAATSTSSSPGPIAALVLLVALGLGATQLTACKGPTPVPVQDVIDCIKLEGRADWADVVARLSPDLGNWGQMLADIEALGPKVGFDIARCVGEELIAQYLSAKRAVTASTWSAHDAAEKIRAAASSPGRSVTFKTSFGNL